MILALRRLRTCLHGPSRKPGHIQTGDRGELEALFFLRGLGYQVVERRWRAPERRGDLDLVAWEGDILCFIEVKSRTARDRYVAAIAVNEQKQRTLRLMARAYLRSLPRQLRRVVNCRFDVVSVYLLNGSAAGKQPLLQLECELIRNAFPWIE